MTDAITISGVYGPAIPVPGEFSDAIDGVIASCDTADNLVLNCSFETGDFTNWVPQDITNPFLAQAVAGPTYVGYSFFTTAPVDGVYSALNGFDGEGPGTIELGQDINLPADSTITLEFSHRGAWDLQSYGATLDREFEVVIEPSGGGAPLETIPVLTATVGDLVTDSGLTLETLDLSMHSGQSVRLNFVWTVPESFSGPGLFEIDNVSVVAGPVIPEPSPFTVPAVDLAGLVVLGALTWVLACRMLGKP